MHPILASLLLVQIYGTNNRRRTRGGSGIIGRRDTGSSCRGFIGSGGRPTSSRIGSQQGGTSDYFSLNSGGCRKVGETSNGQSQKFFHQGIGWPEDFTDSSGTGIWVVCNYSNNLHPAYWKKSQEN